MNGGYKSYGVPPRQGFDVHTCPFQGGVDVTNGGGWT